MVVNLFTRQRVTEAADLLTSCWQTQARLAISCNVASHRYAVFRCILLPLPTIVPGILLYSYSYILVQQLVTAVLASCCLFITVRRTSRCLGFPGVARITTTAVHESIVLLTLWCMMAHATLTLFTFCRLCPWFPNRVLYSSTCALCDDAVLVCTIISYHIRY